MRIEESAEPLIEEGVLKILEFHQAELEAGEHSVMISGRPLHIFDEQGERHFSECGVLSLCKVRVLRVGVGKIPPVGHRHIPDEFISQEGYPIVNCIDVTGRNIIFGIKESLGFEICL
jgi:hypothetical protein